MNKTLIVILFVVIVIAGGYFAWQYWPKTQPVVDSQQNQTPVDGTVNWKTYRSEQYGFVMKYPQEWTFQEEQKGDSYEILFRDPTNKGSVLYPNGITAVRISTESVSSNSVEEWFSQHFKVGPNRPKELIPKYSNLNIGQIPAIKFVDPISIGGCEETVVLIKDAVLFIWYRYPATCSYSAEIFDQVLSTFKFLPQK